MTKQSIIVAMLCVVVGVGMTAGVTAESSSEGPFEGTVVTGETDTHYYANSEPGQVCPQQIVEYTVTLSWDTAADTLALSAGGQKASGDGGFLAVSFWDNYCTKFPIDVTGVAVADLASYTVEVHRDDGSTTA